MAAKQAFLTAYSEKPVYFSPIGTEEEVTFSYEINKYGIKELLPTGTRNIQQEIDSYEEETKLENVLARCIAGDTSMLRPDGIYADVSKMPKNMIEARQSMQKLENLWNDLPIDIKKKYEMNLDMFIATAGKESWLIDMGMIEKQVETLEKVETITEAAKEAEA